MTLKKFLSTRLYLNPMQIAHSSLFKVLESAKKYAKGNLLDIGCGNKPYYDLFAPLVDKYIGIEIPSTLSKSKVVDVYASGLNLPFKNESFDTVISNQVLEHIPEPYILFSEAYRVLKYNGYLILTTPQVWGLHEIPNDYYRYTPYGLKYLAEKSGFKVEYTEPTCGLWATVGQRISSFIFYTYGGNIKFIKYFTVTICAIVQIIAVILDKIHKHKGDTLDNIIVATKVKQN